MYLRTLSLTGFRNLTDRRYDFQQPTLFIFGDNAQGKTNLLESIYFICLTKSFRTHEEAECLTLGSDHFCLQAVLVDDRRVEHHVQVQYDRNSGKKIMMNGKPVYQYSSFIGQFPIVKLSREDHEITSGPPQQRRRYFNILLSQLSVTWLAELGEYERVLKQRNRVLQQLSHGRSENGNDLDVWNEQLLVKAERVFEMRCRAAAELNPLLAAFYKEFSPEATPLQIRYAPHAAPVEGESFRSTFRHRLQRCQQQERRQGISLIGPHRDEFLFFIGDRELRRFGSRGEHKSALISLKAAEVVLLREKLNKLPIILLDDLYAELDLQRGVNALHYYSRDLQRFITGTSFDYQVMQPYIQDSDQVLWMKQGYMARAKNE